MSCNALQAAAIRGMLGRRPRRSRTRCLILRAPRPGRTPTRAHRRSRRRLPGHCGRPPHRYRAARFGWWRASERPRLPPRGRPHRADARARGAAGPHGADDRPVRDICPRRIVAWPGLGAARASVADRTSAVSMGDASRRLRRTFLTGARHTVALVLRPLDATFRLNAPTHSLHRTGNESDLQRAVAQKAFLFPSAEDVEETLLSPERRGSPQARAPSLCAP